MIGTGRRDSAAQISPPNERQNSPTQRSRRMSITELFSWTSKATRSSKLHRRDTLADIAKPLRQKVQESQNFETRRESSVDSGIKSHISINSKRELSITELRNDFYWLWSKKEPSSETRVLTPTSRRGKVCFFLKFFAM